MMALSCWLSIPIFFLAWAWEYPHAALSLIRTWKRRINDFAVRRASRQAIQRLAQDFKVREASEGCDQELIEEILAENLPEITQRLERKWSGEYSD
jgi:hypothetical protein